MVNPDIIFGRLGNRMFQGAYLLAQAKRGEIPDIYVQDPAYFEGCKDEILQFYRQDIPPLVEKTAIHVRRGDYVNNKFYVDLTETDYYQRAMEQFTIKEFIVFSDDLEWCKEQEIFKNCQFFTYYDEVKDMNLMAACTGHIIANSSFSWWAAYISPYTEKVIAPKRWYADGVERTKCPPEWVRL